MTDIVTDTRALLRLFRQSDYGDLHVRSGDYEMFVARPHGGANPLRASMAQAGTSPEPSAPTHVEATEHLVSAPHIASFVSALAIGSAVAAGDAVARIELLGEPIDLLAEQAGLVTDVMAKPGALVEYAAPLVRLLAA
jgi:biotin carboxyl carrier protein